MSHERSSRARQGGERPGRSDHDHRARGERPRDGGAIRGDGRGSGFLTGIPNIVFAGVALASPRASLAASIRGVELEPTNQRHYVNAAVALIGYGRLPEANGMLSLAAKVRAPAGDPFGITAASALRNAQGELALATGRYADAEALFRSAVQMSPLLAEARLGVAHALICQDKRIAAVRWRIRGERRQDGTTPGDGTPESVADPEPAVTIEEMGDAGIVNGVDLASFGSFKRPANAAEGAAAADEFRALHQAALDRGLALAAQQDAIPLDYGNRALGRWIRFVSERIERDATLQGFDEQLSDLTAEWLDLTGLMESRPQCYYTNQHDVLFDFHRRYEAVAEQYARYHHRLLTSLAAQVADSAYAQHLNLEADELAASLYAGVIQLVSYTTRSEHDEGADGPPPTEDDPNPCYRGEPTGAASGENRPEDASPATDPCSAAKAIRSKIRLGGYVSAEFSCESGKIEVIPTRWGVSQAYVGLFGEAAVRWRNGDVTAVTGVKSAISTGGIPGLPTVGISGKVGMYVTGGRGTGGLKDFDGGTNNPYTVKDYGIRVQSDVDVPLGSSGAVTTIAKFDDKVDISLVGVFAPQQ